MTLEGHRDYTSEDLDLDRIGQTYNVDATLVPITGTVVIEGDPGAEVRIGTEDGPGGVHHPLQHRSADG